jgi:hypothetical protein
MRRVTGYQKYDHSMPPSPRLLPSTLPRRASNDGPELGGLSQSNRCNIYNTVFVVDIRKFSECVCRIYTNRKRQVKVGNVQTSVGILNECVCELSLIVAGVDNISQAHPWPLGVWLSCAVVARPSRRSTFSSLLLLSLPLLLLCHGRIHKCAWWGWSDRRQL